MQELEAEKQKALEELKKAKAIKQKAVQKRVDEMDKHWKSFCATLSLDEWDQAQGIWAQLD